MQSLGTTVSVVGGGVGVVTEGVKAGIAGLMSLAAQGSALPTEGGGVFSITFNQDYSSLGVGTRIGYRLYSLSTLDKLELICDNDTREMECIGECLEAEAEILSPGDEEESYPGTSNEDTCIVERLFSSSLVAVVSLSSPRKLKVCHFKKNSEICNYSYPNTILGVKLNRARLVVCLEESLYIHNIRDMKVLHTIRDTPPNPTGLCALSISNENCFLAYPGSNTIGQVQIFDAQNLQAKIMIPAHDSPLAAISFNASGTKIATASEKGTVIRVFSVGEGARLHELRRGMKRCATIFSLAFSPDSLFLCASSNTETVHVFRLEEIKETRPPVVEEQQGLMGWMTKAVSASASYLPTPVADMMSQGRAFATVTLPFQGVRNVCAIATIQKQTRVLVASMDGYLYVYSLNTSEGGDCTLIKQHRLDGNEGGPTTGECTGASTATPGPYPGAAKKTEPAAHTDGGGGGEGTYAGVLRGPASVMTEADKMSEMAAACESPPKSVLKFDDESEFPPV
ncbi:WD repeat domain phosphoinositide-interacting protein 2-like isoform X3 [Portunus trituberculatus]|uniref:WD repeat domain phosphoinositide-interacting protein 2-like isoform X3 n=1 Tax=Portunus trituberculatus TaxID=210409 RepID=UPI001E1CF24B|nr:WD repeat domain phosphoinositide-interacting protein 2-like isoform X3 [Portunus trituberculatus]